MDLQYEKILENNRMIYKFMESLEKAGQRVSHVPRPQYHDSWDWLMPVIEQLGKKYDITIRWYDGDCIAEIYRQNIEGDEVSSCGNYEPPIKNVYIAVVNAIKKLKL